MSTQSTGADFASKAMWRRSLLSDRDEVTPSNWAAESAAIGQAALAWLTDPTRAHRVTTVCAYVPMETEPGARSLFDDLRARDVRVLLPVVVRGQALDWAEYCGEDSLAPAAYGLLEPTGPRLGASAITTADVALVPALAVDRKGIRLGRGGGYYDRSLSLAPKTCTVALLRDEEFVDELPSSGHDVPVRGVLTPSCGLIHLPLR